MFGIGHTNNNGRLDLIRRPLSGGSLTRYKESQSLTMVLPTASPFQKTVLPVDRRYITRCTAALATEHRTFEQCLDHPHVNMKIWEKEWHLAHGNAHLALVYDDHIRRKLGALCEP